MLLGRAWWLRSPRPTKTSASKGACCLNEKASSPRCPRYWPPQTPAICGWGSRASIPTPPAPSRLPVGWRSSITCPVAGPTWGWPGAHGWNRWGYRRNGSDGRTGSARGGSAPTGGRRFGLRGCALSQRARLRPRQPVRRPAIPLLVGTWGERLTALASEIAGELKVGGSADPAMVRLVRRRLGAARTVVSVVTVVGERVQGGLRLRHRTMTAKMTAKTVDSHGHGRTEAQLERSLERSVERLWTPVEATRSNFKTVCGAVRAVPGGFDSHPSPPPYMV